MTYAQFWQRLGYFTLAALVVLAGCSNDPVVEVDWCYTFDFTAQSYGVNFVSGSWVTGEGLVSDGSNALSVSYTHSQQVNTALALVTVARGVGITGDINIAANGIIFGVSPRDGVLDDGTLRATLPGALSEVEVPFPALGATDTGATFNITIMASAEIRIPTLEIRGFGVNPFLTNECPKGTPTSTGTSTPTVTQTATATRTTTPTPTATDPLCPDTDEPNGPFYLALGQEFDVTSETVFQEAGGPEGAVDIDVMNFRVRHSSFSDNPTRLEVTIAYIDFYRGDMSYNYRGGVPGHNVYARFIFDTTDIAIMGADDFGTAAPYTHQARLDIGNQAAYQHGKIVDEVRLNTRANTNFNETYQLAHITDIRVYNIHECDFPTVTPTPTHTTTPPTNTPTITYTPSITFTPTPYTLTPTRTLVPTPTPFIVTLPPTLPPPPATWTPQPTPNINIRATLTTFWSTVTANAPGTWTAGPPATGTVGIPGDLEGIGGIGTPNPNGISAGVGVGLDAVAGSGANVFSQANGWLNDVGSTVSGFLNGWFFAVPQPLPGLPSCRSVPLESDLCAIYYALTFTLFAGPIGVLLVPVGVAVLDIFAVLLFIRFGRAILARAIEITKGGGG